MSDEQFVISGSSIADFQSCPLRWCYRWVSNRVPRRIPQALRTGTAVHKAFERSILDELTPGDALQQIIDETAGAILDSDEVKSRNELIELVEPLRHWSDAFPVEETLEVETPFEMNLGEGIVFQGRPDRVARMDNNIFHVQYKTVQAQQNLGVYLNAARHSLHELLYGWYLERKYPGYTYSGTLYTIIRKLQYKSRAKASPGKILHEPHEFFMQSLIGIDPRLQRCAFEDATQLGIQMREVAAEYSIVGYIPPNRGMDRGPYGNSHDPYLAVIMEEASLADDSLFMDREDPYAEDTE